MLYFDMVGTTFFHYFQNLEKILRAAGDDSELFTAIVDAPFHDKVSATHIDLGIIVLLQVDKKEGVINRIALSNTPQAAGAVKMSEKPFSEIKIPLDYPENAIAQTIKTGKPHGVNDWQYLFVPELTPRAARFNQAGAGVEYSWVYPLRAREGGAIIFSYYQVGKNIDAEHRDFMEGYANLVEEQLRSHPKPPHPEQILT